MKANGGKSHLLMRCKETTHYGFKIKSIQKEMQLGINLDCELKFEDHVSFICKKDKPKTSCACPNCTIHGSKAEQKDYERI